MHVLPCPTTDLKELQTVTLEWPPESSVCKPLANANSFSCHCASYSSCSLLPVLSPSFWPHSLRSISLLKGCIQNQNNAPGGADPGREFQVFVLYTISFHPCQPAQQVQRQPIWRKPHNIQSWFCLMTLAKQNNPQGKTSNHFLRLYTGKPETMWEEWQASRNIFLYVSISSEKSLRNILVKTLVKYQWSNWLLEVTTHSLCYQNEPRSSFSCPLGLKLNR